jgi:hypothetical protein
MDVTVLHQNFSLKEWFISRRLLAQLEILIRKASYIKLHTGCHGKTGSVLFPLVYMKKLIFIN